MHKKFEKEYLGKSQKELEKTKKETENKVIHDNDVDDGGSGGDDDDVTMMVVEVLVLLLVIMMIHDDGYDDGLRRIKKEND